MLSIFIHIEDRIIQFKKRYLKRIILFTDSFSLCDSCVAVLGPKDFLLMNPERKPCNMILYLLLGV